MLDLASMVSDVRRGPMIPAYVYADPEIFRAGTRTGCFARSWGVPGARVREIPRSPATTGVRRVLADSFHRGHGRGPA